MSEPEMFGDPADPPKIVADMGPVPPGTACDACGSTDSPGYIAWPVGGSMGPLLCNACEALRLTDMLVEVP